MLTACVDIGGTNTQAALIDVQGAIVTAVKKPTNASSADSAAGGAIELLKELIESPEAKNAGVKGIGAAVAGTVDFKNGVVVFSPNLPLRRTPLKTMLGEALKLPVIVDNDANLAALGENRFGAGTGAVNMVMLTIGTGIGGGIIIGGELYRGSDGGAGEFGHMVIDTNGPVCGCGNRGCLEAIAGGRAITAATGSQTEIERAAGEAIGIAISNIMNALNPEIVVLGGGVIEDRGELVGIAAAMARACALSPNRDNVKIVEAALGNRAGLIGAAALFS